MTDRVVAIGGGHGLAAVLRALRLAGEEPTGVVSVADDGGSTGRLRRDLGVLGMGDLRKCLVALADEGAGPWASAFEYRFPAGELAGHALGNLALLGLLDATGDWTTALAAAGEPLGVRGRVLPATSVAVDLVAETARGTVRGQDAIQHSVAAIRSVRLDPADAPSPAEVTAAIRRAELIVLAPGSLYTSLIPALLPPAVLAAVSAAEAPVVAVVNLVAQTSETTGMDAAAHLRAVTAIGIRVDRAVAHDGPGVPVDPRAIADLGIELSVGDLARSDLRSHAPAKLAQVLAALLQS